MKKPNFQKMALSPELELLKALNEKKATKAQIKALVEDIKKHLASSNIATIDNYHGVYGKAAALALQKNYAYFDEEKIIDEKLFKILDFIADNALKNKKIKTSPQLFQFLVNYIKPETITNDNSDKVIVLGNFF